MKNKQSKLSIYLDKLIQHTKPKTFGATIAFGLIFGAVITAPLFITTTALYAIADSAKITVPLIKSAITYAIVATSLSGLKAFSDLQKSKQQAKEFETQAEISKELSEELKIEKTRMPNKVKNTTATKETQISMEL